LIRFILVLLVTGGVLALSGIVAVQQHVVSGLPSFFYQTLIFLVFSTGVIYGYLYKAGSTGFFVQLYLLTMAVKMLAYGAYIFIIVHQDKQGAFANVVFFMIIYGLFTALEIGFLYRKITHR
jgi:hypothetical protein